MNTIVTAEIDVATPTGRRIIKELERHNKRTLSQRALQQRLLR